MGHAEYDAFGGYGGSRLVAAIIRAGFSGGKSRRRLELGLDDENCRQGVQLLRATLADQGSLTRAEVVERLAERGLRLEGQAIPHMIAFAALEGVVCGGPERDGEPTYVLLDDWVKREKAIAREVGQEQLVERYLAAFGGGAEDCAAWSGLSLREVREAWGRVAGKMVEVEIGGKTTWLLKSRASWLDERPDPEPVVRLLPRFDTYLLGYRDRDHMLAAGHAQHVNKGGGMIAATVLVNGQLVGTWHTKLVRKQLQVTVEPFEALAAEWRDGLEAEVEDVGRFLGVKAVLEVSA